MHNFEQIRSHLVSAGYRLTLLDPFVACVELSLAQGKRHQAIFLAELQDDDGRNYLRVSTAIAPTTGMDARRALAFNWQSRVGYLAVGELDGVPAQAEQFLRPAAAFPVQWSAGTAPAARTLFAGDPALEKMLVWDRYPLANAARIAERTLSAEIAAAGALEKAYLGTV